MPTFAGWQLNIRIASSTGSAGLAAASNLSGIQRISYRKTENIDVKEECGTRFTFLVEGVYALTGTIERFYTGSGTWSWYSGSDKGESATKEWCIGIYPAGYSTGNPKIQITGVKFNVHEESQRPAANLYTETLDFIATGSIYTGSIP